MAQAVVTMLLGVRFPVGTNIMCMNINVGRVSGRIYIFKYVCHLSRHHNTRSKMVSVGLDDRVLEKIIKIIVC